MNDQPVVFKFEHPQPQRLDKFLVTCLPDFSRARLQSLIKDGKVLVNGEPAHKSGQVIDSPSQVEVIIPPTVPSQLIPEAIPLDIVYEDEHVLVINKPAGMVVHPAAGHSTGTLVHAVLSHAPDIEGIGGEQRPGVVHRLDKDTSGLILMAKDDRTHRFLQEQFRLRKVEKTYLALVDGEPPTPSGRVEASIGRDLKARKQMAIVTALKGRAATSSYRTLESFPEHTLLEVKPETGRTHQIRLHMAFIGCPIAGDTIYGRRKSTLTLKRHFLHAAQLVLQLPGEKTPSTFAAPLPPELEGVLQSLRTSLQAPDEPQPDGDGYYEHD